MGTNAMIMARNKYHSISIPYNAEAYSSFLYSTIDLSGTSSKSVLIKNLMLSWYKEGVNYDYTIEPLDNSKTSKYHKWCSFDFLMNNLF